MKNRIVGFASLLLIFVAYFVFRYMLFKWHGMKEFPFYLLIVGVIIIVVSGILRRNKIVPVFTVAGYIFGFFCGYLLAVPSYDSGGTLLNNMWQIWMNSYGTAIISGILIETFHGRSREKK